MATGHQRALLVVTIAALGAIPVRADVSAARQDADRLKQKVAAIEQQAVTSAPGEEHRTTVTQEELNAFLALDAGEWLPAGVTEPTLKIMGTGRVAARAVVDLDAVRRQRKRTSLFDPTNFLAGQLALTAAGVLQTTRGVGRFDLESATVAGVPVPATVLQEIVSYYTRTPDRPSGIGLADSFALPARIQSIEVEPERVIIVQ